MAIIAKKPESSWTPCPEGLHQAVCVDVVDLGIQKSAYGEKHKVELRWQTEVENEDAQPSRRFQLRKWYTNSLHEKANLRKDLECWRGQKFTEDELRGFDLEKLLGVNCQLQVIHNLTDDGKTYDNIQAIVPHNVKLPKIAPLDYVREKDRAKAHGNGHAATADADEDIPFMWLLPLLAPLTALGLLFT